MFYYKGSRILDINDFKRDGIEYEEYDLLHGLNEEQMDYINYTLYYLKEYNSIEYYVTEEVKLKIDR
jgi:hypothetical protein